MKEYPCRTEEISGTSYSISIWNDASKLEPSGLMSPYSSWEEADALGKRMMANLPNGKYEVNTRLWKKKVCIECGEDVY
jgi:hypothetical protein